MECMGISCVCSGYACPALEVSAKRGEQKGNRFRRCPYGELQIKSINKLLVITIALGTFMIHFCEQELSNSQRLAA